MDDLDARLKRSVGGWLNVDVVDWQSPHLVDDAVSGVLGGLYPLSNPERAALKCRMIRMLSESEWTATITWFMRATDVNWTFDAEMEQVLKEIVTKLSRSFEPYASP